MQVAKAVTISGVTSSSYYQTDILGNTRLVTASSGNPPSTIFSSDYKAFGINYAKSGLEEFMYTGKPLDSNTGLYYFGARF